MNRKQDIQRILEDFKGVKNIPGIKSAKKRVLITKMKNEKREIITSQKGIANVFGEFYKKLYDDNEQEELNKKSVRMKMRAAKKLEKMSESSARSAHCQRCANCSRQYFTADYIHDTTKNSGRSGGIQKLIPNNRSSCDAQSD